MSTSDWNTALIEDAVNKAREDKKAGHKKNRPVCHDHFDREEQREYEIQVEAYDKAYEEA